MSVRTRLLLPIAVLAPLALAPAASAAVTISVNNGVLVVAGDSADNVIFETGFDEATPWFTSPAPGTLTAGQGCNQLSVNNVECPGTKVPTSGRIDLGDGDDLFLWSGTSVPLTIDGGAGDDELSGGQGSDKIAGGSGDDILVGFGGDDRITGNEGNDVIDGSSGDDTIDGGPGVDKLNGDGDGDGEYALRRYGTDTITSRDDVGDQVICEGLEDTVIADKLDDVADDCENVSRVAGSGSAGSGLTPIPRPAPVINPPFVVVSNAKGLTLKVRRGKLPRIGAFANSSSIRLVVKANKACVATTSMTVGKGEAKRLRYRTSRKLNTVTNDIGAARDTTIFLRAPSGFRKAVRGKSRVSVSLKVTCKPVDGKSVTANVAIRLKK